MHAIGWKLPIGVVLGLVTAACGTTVKGAADAQPEELPVDAARPLPDALPLPDATPPSPVEVHITADNAYGFGYGSAAMMANYFGGIENTIASEIFGCGDGVETYSVPATYADAGNYLYVIAWADKSTSQGVLGQFKREGSNEVVYTGAGAWQVCATGQDYIPGSGGPSLVTINQELTRCNVGDGDPDTTSAGWVDATGTTAGKLEVGEDNSTDRTSVTAGNEFPITCASLIDAEARWMWFNWDPENIVWPTQSPFIWPGGSENPDGQFLIFRLGAEVIE